MPASTGSPCGLELKYSNEEVVESSNVAKLTSNAALEEMIRQRNSKTSQNITESVPVPSSEHVAEIVGRQGCKIKALRAKTNTYIKTPIRGEQPQFVITGRREDVLTAKREIQLAADHFSQIRARRGGAFDASQLITSPCSTRQGTPTPPINTPACKHSVSSSSSSSISLSPPVVHKLSAAMMPSPSHVELEPAESTLIRQQTQQAVQLQPGQIVNKVLVPLKLVGLVVGPKGATIKRIQQNTNTYIITPIRASEPVFEIQGKPDDVKQAKAEIENYIQLRTNSTQNASKSYSSSSSSSSSSSDSSNEQLGAYFNSAMTPCQSNSDYEFFALDIMDELKVNSFKSGRDTSDMLFTSQSGSSHEQAASGSIWSSPNSFPATTGCLVNSIQQNLNNSSPSSSSPSNASSASSSFSLANSKPLFNQTNESFQFLNELLTTQQHGNSLSGLLAGIEGMQLSSPMDSKNLLIRNDPFLNTDSLSSSLSNSSSSMFQSGEHALFNSLNAEFNYLSAPLSGANNFFAGFQQQPQYF